VSKSYIRFPGNNFGDNLNDVIFPKLGITKVVPYKKHIDIPDNCYLGLGSIIGKRLNRKVKVLGSGSGGGELPGVELEYGFVRGKLTCKFLGIDESLGIGDTAYYLDDYIQSKASKNKSYDIGIIPHHSTAKKWRWGSNIPDKLKGSNIIDPRLPIDEFIFKVSECRHLLCEAMHGAICADILRTSFSPVEIETTLNYFKWNDWASTVGLELDFGTIDAYKIYSTNDNTFKNVCSAVKTMMENEIDDD
jgi:succinoglycan biosynthesis protein ExoV